MADNDTKSGSHWRLKFHWPHSHASAARHAHPEQKPKPKRLDFTQNISTEIPYPPFVNIEGVPNFRDLGGFACAAAPAGNATGDAPSDATEKAAPAAPAAHSVRSGYAYRCSELSQLTAQANVTMVETLKIRTLYDLRSEKEGADPRGQPQGVKCVSTPVFRREDLTRALSVQQLGWATAADESPHAGFSQGYVDWYRQIALYGAKFAYRAVFEHIRDRPDEPFVFHCTAGKDRTGVLSALILSLCGVDDDAVAWEYALTVPGMGVWEAAVEQEMVGDSMMPIRSHPGMTRDEAHRICGSRASNMRRWLEVVLHGEFGGAAKYLRDHVHFSQEDVDKITANLVADKEPTVKPVDVPGMEDHPQT